MKYGIQSNDGRWVTQEGTTPVLTRAKALRYVWPTKEEAEQMLEKYALFFQASSPQNLRTGVLALAVARLDDDEPEIRTIRIKLIPSEARHGLNMVVIRYPNHGHIRSGEKVCHLPVNTDLEAFRKIAEAAFGEDMAFFDAVVDGAAKELLQRELWAAMKREHEGNQ